MATVMKTTRDVKGVGLSIPRPDGPEKVTGKVQYVADIAPRGLAHALFDRHSFRCEPCDLRL